jgi:hypothetical protein
LLGPVLVEPEPAQAVTRESAATVTNTRVGRTRRKTSPPEEQQAVANRRGDNR